MFSIVIAYLLYIYKINLDVNKIKFFNQAINLKKIDNSKYLPIFRKYNIYYVHISTLSQIKYNDTSNKTNDNKATTNKFKAINNITTIIQNLDNIIKFIPNITQLHIVNAYNNGIYFNFTKVKCIVDENIIFQRFFENTLNKKYCYDLTDFNNSDVSLILNELSKLIVTYFSDINKFSDIFSPII